MTTVDIVELHRLIGLLTQALSDAADGLSRADRPALARRARDVLGHVERGTPLPVRAGATEPTEDLRVIELWIVRYMTVDEPNPRCLYATIPTPSGQELTEYIEEAATFADRDSAIAFRFLTNANLGGRDLKAQAAYRGLIADKGQAVKLEYVARVERKLAR